MHLGQLFEDFNLFAEHILRFAKVFLRDAFDGHWRVGTLYKKTERVVSNLYVHTEWKIQTTIYQSIAPLENDRKSAMSDQIFAAVLKVANDLHCADDWIPAVVAFSASVFVVFLCRYYAG